MPANDTQFYFILFYFTGILKCMQVNFFAQTQRLDYFADSLSSHFSVNPYHDRIVVLSGWSDCDGRPILRGAGGNRLPCSIKLI